MSLLKSSLMQAQIWNAYRLLSSPNPAERSLAMPTLKELALPALDRMARDPDSANRALAIHTLKNIVGGRSFAVLVPLLKDRDPHVRALVPSALISTGGALEAARQVTNALQEGFSTAE